jgi:hypothetical protein
MNERVCRKMVYDGMFSDSRGVPKYVMVCGVEMVTPNGYCAFIDKPLRGAFNIKRDDKISISVESDSGYTPVERTDMLKKVGGSNPGIAAIFENENTAEKIFVNEKYLKPFERGLVPITFKGKTHIDPILCYMGDTLVGIVLPIRMKT